MSQEPSNETPRLIDEALRRGDVEELRRLLLGRPDLLRDDGGTDTWLWNAAACGQLGIVEELVRLGLGVNEPSIVGTHAIDSAAGEGHLAIVNWLLEHGAMIREEKEGRVRCEAMRRAVQAGYLAIVRRLIEAGASADESWGNTNLLMEADFRGYSDVAQLLRSHGAKDLRETTPPDYDSAHEKIIKHMAKKHGPTGSWKSELPGTPLVVTHVTTPTDKRPRQVLFTVGLSDHCLPTPREPFNAIELRVPLPPDWRAEDSSPTWNWPLAAIKDIASSLRVASTLPDDLVFPSGDLLHPLAQNTALCAWMCPKNTSEEVTAADFRRIYFHDLFPIYAEEVALIRSCGVGELLSRLKEKGVPLTLDPARINVGK